MKIDLKKSLDSYRARVGEFRLLQVPALRYLVLDGQGDPNSDPRYAATLQALYPVAYTLKFASKQELQRDYVVPPLEGLWWAGDMEVFTSARDKSQWEWAMMLLVPDWIGDEMVEAAIEAVRIKGAKTAAGPPARLDDVRLATLEEGLCVQTLHVGSFDDEAPVLEEMHHGFIPDNRLCLTGTHHEVYFSDPRKTAPEKLRTLLRQPVLRSAV